MGNTENLLKEIGFGDVDRELAVTRKVLERLPEDKFDWKVHEKSMSLGRLAMHCANLVEWMLDTVAKDALDMASPPKMRNEPAGKTDVLATFDQNVTSFKSAWAGIDDVELSRNWSLRQGETVLYSREKAIVLRMWCLSHLIHHRAQLCVYLRIHGIPVPGVYFNSSDEADWKFE